MDSLDDYYEILDVSPSSSLAEIKMSFRDLAQVWHPDRFAHSDRLREKAERKFKEINHAYSIIRARLESGTRGARKVRKTPAEPARSSRASGKGAAKGPSDEGSRIPPEDAAAFGWYAQAAEQGQPDSQVIVATMYAEGEGVARDEAKAVFWYQKAAAQGYPQAEFQIGLRHHSGRGLRKDEAQALKWFERAAFGGYGKAQIYLGLMFSDGQGVPRDPVTAFAWFDAAAAADYRGASSLRDAVQQTLNREDFWKAKKRARELRGKIGK